jgi:hypothetical protein
MTELTQDILNDFADAAQAADKAGERLNFGQLTFGQSRFIHFERDDDGNFLDRKEITAEQYRQLPKRNTQMEICFRINVREFNPNINWDGDYYERYVAIKGGDNDWAKIVKPSLGKVLGKKAMQDYASALASVNGKYVQVADVPQVRDPDFNTIEFRTIYASRDECFLAWNERFGGQDRATKGATVAPAGAAVPDGYTPDSWKTTVPIIKDALAKPGADVNQVAANFMVPPKFVIDIQSGVYD